MSGFRAKPPKGSLRQTGDPRGKGLVSAWLFNENIGITVYDSVGQVNKGTLTNLPTWGSGQFGKALTFASASSQYIQGGAIPSFGAKAWALSCWFKSSSATLQTLMSIEDATPTKAALLQLNAAGTLHIEGYDGTNNPKINTTVTNYADGLWHHVLSGYDGASLVILVDGGSKLTSFTTLNSITSSATTVRIGRRTYSGELTTYMNGSIDAPMVWNRFPTVNEYAAFYADTFRMFRRRSVPVPLKATAAGAATGLLLKRRREMVAG